MGCIVLVRCVLVLRCGICMQAEAIKQVTSSWSLFIQLSHTPYYISSATCTATHFSKFSHKRHDFREKTLLNIRCVFRFSLQMLSHTFLTLRGIPRDYHHNMYIVDILIRYRLNLNFRDRFFEKILKCKVSWKSVQREPSCFMRMHGQPYMTKPTVAFRNFATAPVSGSHQLTSTSSHRNQMALGFVGFTGRSKAKTDGDLWTDIQPTTWLPTFYKQTYLTLPTTVKYQCWNTLTS